MADIYIPGVKSRFDTEKLVEGMMAVERLPKERAEKTVSDLENQKTYWRDLGRRVTDVRDSARLLYSFQNPFNDRVVSSSDESAVMATATREAAEQERRITVSQIALADRFLSAPLDPGFSPEPGTYAFSVGQETVSFAFRGGSMSDLVDALNRRGRNQIQASLVTITPGSRSLLLEARVTGAENRLGFAGAAEDLAMRIGMIGYKVPEPEPRDETPLTGPPMPFAGSVFYGGIVIENDSAPPVLPQAAPASAAPATAPVGGAAGDALAPAGSLRANAQGDLAPLNPVSVAQDAVLTMEGIKVTRPANTVDDLIPGVTITLRAPTDRPVTLGVEPDRESVKDAIISLVGNYNRLMAEINVLSRTDDAVIRELTYLSTDERTDYEARLGVFQGDSTLSQLRSSLQRIAAAPYPTSEERGLALLSQIGVGTDVRGSTASSGYDASRLRGYLEIDEKALDTALATHFPAIKDLFGSDTDGDRLVDTGVAYALETITRPYVETAGIIAVKTGTVDTRIDQQQRRIETLDRQLASKEAKLREQYAQMESAYSRMEQQSGSIDQFNQQNSGSNK